MAEKIEIEDEDEPRQEETPVSDGILSIIILVKYQSIVLHTHVITICDQLFYYDPVCYDNSLLITYHSGYSSTSFGSHFLRDFL